MHENTPAIYYVSTFEYVLTTQGLFIKYAAPTIQSSLARQKITCYRPIRKSAGSLLRVALKVTLVRFSPSKFQNHLFIFKFWLENT